VIAAWWEENISVSFPWLTLQGFQYTVTAPALSRASQKATILVSLAEIAVAFLSISVYTSDP
jgi:hypothetical protein